MDQGWIKLYRNLLDKPIWQKSTLEQKVILITLLLMANHKEAEWEWCGQKFKVKPGQFVTSIESIRQKAGPNISTQNVRSALKKFEKYNFLTNQSTKEGRLITIVNWGVYQCDTDEGNKATNKGVTKGQQRGNKGVTTNNNDKNDKNDKKEYINIMSMDLVHEVQKIDLEGVQADQEDETDTEGPVHGREFEVVPSSEAVAPLSDKPTPKEEEKAKLAAEFSEWWQDYPRKDARKEAEAKYIATRRKGATKEGLERAKQNYIRYVRAQGIEKKFIMQGKTFLGPHERWRDWLNDIEVASLVVGSGMAPVPTQAAYEQERAELEQFGGDYKKWWAWKKKQLRQ